MFYRLLLSLIISLALVFSHSGAHAQEITPSEYQVKAAFLYNFLNFVEWPAGKSSEDDPKISVCILGEDPFGPSLDALDGLMVGDKMVAVKRIRNLKGIRNCHSVFISDSEKGDLQEIFHFVEDFAVLTIGDAEGFAEAGGMIGFVTEESKVRFHINIEAAKQSRLKISSKLLRVGHIIGESR